MTADDVVASFDRLADPANGSNALSAFTGMLSKGGTTQGRRLHGRVPPRRGQRQLPLYGLDRQLQRRHPAGRLCRRLREDHDRHRPVQAGEIHAEGRRLLRAQRRITGARRPLPDRIEFTFYADYQPQILALQGGQVDIIQQLPVLQGVGLLNDPEFRHHQHAVDRRTSRCTCAPTWIRSRTSACAAPSRSCLDRPKLVQGLMKGRAEIGNDSPFAAAYPVDRPERAAAREEHRRGQAADGSGRHGKGFKTTLTTEKYLEIPDYAVLIQNAVKEIGGDIELNIMDQGAYYGDAVYGKSPLARFRHGHHRLRPPRRAERLPVGAAAQRRHLEFGAFQERRIRHAGDELYRRARPRSAAAPAPARSRRLLLDETPVLFTYFYDFLTATKKGATGVAADRDEPSVPRARRRS